MLVAVATFVRIALAATVPLLPDEAYYWDWSRYLAAGYFDHPPAVALLIRAGTNLLGNGELGVRAGSILAGMVASFAIIVTSIRLSTSTDRPERDADASLLDEPGARAALLMLVIPGALLGFVIATPDAALLAAAALTIAALERAIASVPRSRAAFGWWCAAGIMLGIAFSSKYTAVLIPLGVLVALLARRELRSRLSEAGPYAATAIALVVFAPNLVWNARNGWISFAFQLHHGLGQAHGSIAGRELALIGGQLGIVSPIIAIIAVVAIARALRGFTDPRRFMLAVIATIVLAFFALSAVRRPVEPNWPVLALVAALPLLATMNLTGQIRAWLVGGAALGASFTIAVAAQASARVFHVTPRRDPVSRAFGWHDVARAVTRADSLARGCKAVWIAADRYQDAAELAYTLPAQPRVFALNLGGRPNQYDLWPSIYAVAAPGDCALVVVDEGPAGQAIVAKFGGDTSSLIGDAQMTWRGAVVGRRAVWLVRGIPAAPLVPIKLSAHAAVALAAVDSAFQSRAAMLDSIVAIYRHGPAPNSIAATSVEPIANVDRQKAIDARINQLQSMLRRTGLGAVYRDARYRDCTFVRATDQDSTDVGYVHAPAGCRLASGRSDQLLVVQHMQGSWYGYASPER